MRQHSFPKTARIRRRREFLRVQRTGRRRHTRHFVIVSCDGDAGGGRLGVTVSGKIGNAVTRNYIKRRVRELYRMRRTQLTPPMDIVVIAKRGAGTLSLREMDIELGPSLGGVRT